jgi:ribose transport system permease protein/erythritol transport system permease protein
VGTIPGTVLGVLFLRIVMDAVAKVIKTNADIYEGLIVGSVVVVAVALSQLRQAGRLGKRFFGGLLGLVTIINLSLLAGGLGALLGPESAQGAAVTGGSIGLAILVLLLIVRFWESRREAKMP